jgi:hypothetical protein
MGKKDTSKYDLTEAKELYMSFLPVIEISKKVPIPYKTLIYHAKKWKEERRLLTNELLKELTENKKTILSSLVGNSLECVDRAILELKNRFNPPTIKEARMLTHIVSEIDKILRLDEGTPTDIIAEHRPSTVIELREQLKKDPFYIEDAKFKEITHETTTTTPTSACTGSCPGSKTCSKTCKKNSTD